jgi:hypothetical protein
MQITTVTTIRDCKSRKQHVTVYYCMPPKDGIKTQTCSGSNDRVGEEWLMRWRCHSEIIYLMALINVHGTRLHFQWTVETP